MKFEPEDLQAIAETVVELLSTREQTAGVLPTERLAYPEAEAARLIGVPKHVLRDCRLRGEISAEKVGKCWIYSRQTLLQFLHKNSGSPDND